MAGVEFISITETYNLLNTQDTCGRPRVAEENFLLLLDTRSIKDYRTAHIKFSQYVRRNSEKFLKPMNINIDCIENIIILDEDSRSNIGAKDQVKQLAESFSDWGARNKVKILDGGYRGFTKKYSFLTTFSPNLTSRQIQKDILTMPLELSEKTYVGSPEQATKENLHNLKIDKIILAEKNCELQLEDPEMQEKIICTEASEMKRKTEGVKDKRVLIICNKGTEWSLVIGILLLKLATGLSREACIEKVKNMEPNFILGKAHLDIINTF